MKSWLAAKGYFSHLEMNIAFFLMLIVGCAYAVSDRILPDHDFYENEYLVRGYGFCVCTALGGLIGVWPTPFRKPYLASIWTAGILLY